jgi:hypothetical protein
MPGLSWFRRKMLARLLSAAAIGFVAGAAFSGNARAAIGGIGPIGPPQCLYRCPAACGGVCCGGSPCWCDGEVCVT